MKQITLFIIATLVSFAGFFNNSAKDDKTEYLENERLCKLFTQKVEAYEKNMRKDFLAEASLESYKHRAELFCKKAEKLKSDKNATTSDTSSVDNNISTQ